MDKRLTIILALKGRHKFTERWLNFANKHLRLFKILIADGSEKNDYYHFDKTKFNLNLEYRTFPTDKDISYFVKKLQNCSQEVNSKYILYANNDDLLFENEIINILDFLDNNNSHVAARGEVYDFSLSSFNEVYGNIIGLKRFIIHHSLESDNSLERLHEFVQKRHDLMHCIVRKNVFNEILKISIENKFFDLTSFSLFYNYYLVTSGKIFCSKNLYMLHQNHKFMLSKNMKLMSIKNSGFISKDFTENFFKTLLKKFIFSKDEQTEQVSEIKDLFYRNFILEKLIKYEEFELNKSFKFKIIDLFKNSVIFGIYVKIKSFLEKKENPMLLKDENYIKVQDFLKK